MISKSRLWILAAGVLALLAAGVLVARRQPMQGLVVGAAPTTANLGDPLEARSARYTPNFDDPASGWPEKTVVASPDEAAPRLRHKPLHGKYQLAGDPARFIVGPDKFLIQYPKSRSYILESGEVGVSNPDVVYFVEQNAAAAAKVGAKVEALDLGSGFMGVLEDALNVEAVRFGTEERTFDVVMAPGPGARGRVIAMARATVRELAETDLPSNRPVPATPSGPSNLPPGVSAPTPTADKANPHSSTPDPQPATGLEPEATAPK